MISAPGDGDPITDAPALLGRYRPVRRIGVGGSALIYRAIDDRLGREVAIKIFKAADETSVASYENELRALASLSHHGLASLIDAGIDRSTPEDPRPFFVLELIPGQTLQAAIEAGPLQPRQIAEVGYDLAEALEYVHSRGITHRDIKPSNIMLVAYGTTTFRTRARLTDFGIAASHDHATALLGGSGTRDELPGTTTGTAAYLSPEQIRGDASTPASDVYALGLVILQCFTRTLAYPGTLDEQLDERLRSGPDIPDSLPLIWRSLVRSMVAADPADRPGAADLAGAFRSLAITPE